MAFTVGSLVRVREREWVVLPDSNEEILMVRPLGGTEDEVTGIYLPLESVEPASFALPDPTQSGDYRSCRLLRDAVRLGFRSSAGPFRSFARIAVEPRPYQLVPLLMALRLDPVRLLIADDVGIGKTVEATLIARELLDRGEIQRMAVLCPPYLAEQWQGELHDKFHIDAELVLASTATRLERRCRLGQSLFEVYPFVVVSLDFIKSEHRREEFLRTCPELVIVDEAHTCAWAGDGRGSSRHQRHHLVSSLAEHPTRHVILVTATPHSGNEAAFRSLLTMLKPAFAELPEDLTGAHNEHHRRHLATHFIQRQRGDIRHYMQADTPFPQREEREATYKLGDEYRRLFQRVLRYAREMLAEDDDVSPPHSPDPSPSPQPLSHPGREASEQASTRSPDPSSIEGEGEPGSPSPLVGEGAGGRGEKALSPSPQPLSHPGREASEQASTRSPESSSIEGEGEPGSPSPLVGEGAGGRGGAAAAYRRRVRWWSVLALLRSLASSPAAAAATLRNRAASADTQTVEEADAVGRRTVFDLMDDESAEGVDLVPGSDIGEQAADEKKHHERLLDMARQAERLMGAADQKLQQVITLVQSLLQDGFQPIVFCRFIPTAEYVATALREHLASVYRGDNECEVMAVTGTLPPVEREARVLQLARSPRRVLVATDCLSEGINLQEHFSAVIHYDLSWNPTRHEQRAGRVDRYGQPQDNVRVLTYYGTDNQIDGVVLDVLLRKHQQIRTSTGVSVPVPTSSEHVMEAILEGLLLRGRPESEQLLLPGMEDVITPQQETLFQQWDDDARRHARRSRTMYAQERIKTDEVMREWQAVRDAIGTGVEVAQFVRDAIVAHGGVVQMDTPSPVLQPRHPLPNPSPIQGEGLRAAAPLPPQGGKGQGEGGSAEQGEGGNTPITIDLQETPLALRDIALMGLRQRTDAHTSRTSSTVVDASPSTCLTARFALPVREHEVYLSRTHPFVEGLATYVMDTALDPLTESVARRCGVITTRQVAKRTTLLLLRFRYHIITKTTTPRSTSTSPLPPHAASTLLAEDCQLVAFTGAPERGVTWLSAAEAEALLLAQPDANTPADKAAHFLRQIIDQFATLHTHLNQTAIERGKELLDAHRRVRTAAGQRGLSYDVQPHLPPDVLGVYVYLPGGG